MKKKSDGEGGGEPLSSWREAEQTVIICCLYFMFWKKLDISCPLFLIYFSLNTVFLLTAIDKPLMIFFNVS